MMSNKSGLSLASIVIYVSLFFVFTVFAIAMSSNMNYKAMDEKANIYVYEQFNKLQYNMLSSSKNSSAIDNIYNKVVFSNNDEYSYDSDKKVILKNGGVLAKNVETFEVIQPNELNNVPNNFSENIDNNIDNICIKINFKKYGKTITKQLVLTTGDDVYEKKT